METRPGKHVKCIFKVAPNLPSQDDHGVESFCLTVWKKDTLVSLMLCFETGSHIAQAGFKLTVVAQASLILLIPLPPAP